MPKRRGRKKPEEGKHQGSGCGSGTGRDERKPAEKPSTENGREARETGWNRSGKPGKRKRRGRHRESSCEATPGRKGTEEQESQVAGTGTEADERKRIGRGQTESESTRQAPEEQLWERIREGRKETNRKPSKGIRGGSLRNQAERAEEIRKARAELSTGEATVRRKREGLKGRNRG